MPKDFGHWLNTSRVHLSVPLASLDDKMCEIIMPAVTRPGYCETESPNLMRSVAELEDDLYQRVARNLYPVDIPRGQDYHPAVMKILMLKILPDVYASSPPWQHAHQLYWQIEAMKGNPDALMWYPV